MNLLRSISIVSACLVGLVPATAGDVANLNIIGFSQDGDVFAFEEFGELDGSGDTYSNRFYIDTTDDSFMAGSPIRITLAEGTATVAATRWKARVAGEKIVPAKEFEADPGFLAGFNAITEISADPFRIAVNPRPVYAPIDAPVEFRLEEIPVEAPPACENLGDIVGYRLLRIDASPGGTTLVVHEDEAIPASRNCPNGYRIGGVQTWISDNGEPAFAVLIAVRSTGFEGPDFRWMAVTGKL